MKNTVATLMMSPVEAACLPALNLASCSMMLPTNP
jgi:hypothetical protein